MDTNSALLRRELLSRHGPGQVLASVQPIPARLTAAYDRRAVAFAVASRRAGRSSVKPMGCACPCGLSGPPGARQSESGIPSFRAALALCTAQYRRHAMPAPCVPGQLLAHKRAVILCCIFTIARLVYTSRVFNLWKYVGVCSAAPSSCVLARPGKRHKRAAILCWSRAAGGHKRRAQPQGLDCAPVSVRKRIIAEQTGNSVKQTRQAVAVPLPCQVKANHGITSPCNGGRQILC